MSSDESESEGDIIISDYAIRNDKLPKKSKERYIAVYENFLTWRKCKNTDSFNEDVLYAYFEEMAGKYKPTTLWAMYSMVKAGLKCNHDINMEEYVRVSALLKRLSKGYVTKKAKALSVEQVEKFINEAPDDKYLPTKVSLIFGITGGMGRQQLSQLTINDIENQGDVFLIRKPHSKNKLRDSFIVEGKYYDIVKKYKSLRTSKAPSTRFFQQFRDGKCRAQVIGVNRFGHMPKEIAEYLKLPDAESYTGHSFRSISRVPVSKGYERIAERWAYANIDADSSTQTQPTNHHRQPANHHHQPANHHHQPPQVPVQRRERIVEQQHWTNEQCRFCGVFKECSPVSQKPYFMGNKVSLTLNHLRVELDFSIESLPKTVCRDCNKKLLETFEFIKQVNAAQFSLVPVSPNTNAFSVNNMAHCYTTNDINIDVVKAEFESDEEFHSVSKVRENSFKLNETIFLKETHKRKNKEVDKNKAQKKKKVKDKSKYTEESDIDIQNAEFVMDIKEEIVDLDDSNGAESSGELDEMDTDVKPSELEHSDTDYDYRIGNETANDEKSKISSDAQSDDND